MTGAELVMETRAAAPLMVILPALEDGDEKKFCERASNSLRDLESLGILALIDQFALFGSASDHPFCRQRARRRGHERLTTPCG